MSLYVRDGARHYDQVSASTDTIKQDQRRVYIGRSYSNSHQYIWRQISDPSYKHTQTSPLPRLFHSKLKTLLFI